MKFSGSTLLSFKAYREIILLVIHCTGSILGSRSLNRYFHLLNNIIL
jgi:hypothetical protein